MNNILKITVCNMESSGGNKVPNQFIITTEHGVYFQSYQTIITYQDSTSHTTYLDAFMWDYSRTTGKYRNIFLNESKKETEKKIASGIYKLVSLN